MLLCILEPFLAIQSPPTKRRVPALAATLLATTASQAPELELVRLLRGLLLLVLLGLHSLCRLLVVHFFLQSQHMLLLDILEGLLLRVVAIFCARQGLDGLQLSIHHVAVCIGIMNLRLVRLLLLLLLSIDRARRCNAALPCTRRACLAIGSNRVGKTIAARRQLQLQLCCRRIARLACTLVLKVDNVGHALCLLPEKTITALHIACPKLLLHLRG